MLNNHGTIRFALLGAALFAFLGSACSLKHGAPTPPFELPLSYSEQLQESGDQIWPSPELQQAFILYWTRIFSGDIENILPLEVPHVQFLVDERAYLAYIRSMSTATLNNLVIINITDPTPDQVHLRIIMHIDRNEVMHEIHLNDRWVNVGGNWYHILHAPRFFPQISKDFTDARLVNS